MGGKDALPQDGVESFFFGKPQFFWEIKSHHSNKMLREAVALMVIGVVIFIVIFAGKKIEDKINIKDIKPEDLKGIQGNQIILFYDSTCKTDRAVRKKLKSVCKMFNGSVFCALDCSEEGARDAMANYNVGILPALAVVDTAEAGVRLTSLPTLNADVMDLKAR